MTQVSNSSADESIWNFIHIGLFVTGDSEAQFLPLLFKKLTESGHCDFKVIRKIRQVSPRTSEKKHSISVVNTKNKIPDKDIESFGFPARKFIDSGSNYFAILIDDLEYDRKDIIEDVFNRYKVALNTALNNQAWKASVHFLVYMLEAWAILQLLQKHLALKFYFLNTMSRPYVIQRNY